MRGERGDRRAHDLDPRQRLRHVQIEHRLVARPTLHDLRWAILNVELRVEAADFDFAELWVLIFCPRLEALPAELLVAVAEHLRRLDDAITIVIALAATIPELVAVPDRPDEEVPKVWRVPERRLGARAATGHGM